MFSTLPRRRVFSREARRKGVEIAGSPHCLDPLRFALLVAQLPSEIADMHVDVPIVRGEAPSQHLLGQVLTRHHLAGRTQ